MSTTTIAVAAFGGQPARTFTVQAFSSDAGWAPDQLIQQIEELTATGVDGASYRLIGGQYPTFAVRTVQSVSTFAQAMDLARVYASVVGRICSISSERYQSRTRFTILACAPAPQSGVVADTTGAAFVEAQWTMRRVA